MLELSKEHLALIEECERLREEVSKLRTEIIYLNDYISDLQSTTIQIIKENSDEKTQIHSVARPAIVNQPC